MAGIVGDINPKTMESAKRQFVELYGSALAMNTYLKVALVLVSLVALGLLGLNFHTAARYSQVKPLVVRIDEVGRAEAVVYDASRYQPQPPELRYFLTQFVVKHFGRIRSTLQREYPDSLFFLNPALADATIAQNDQSRVLEMFVTNPTADEIEVVLEHPLHQLRTNPAAGMTGQGIKLAQLDRVARIRMLGELGGVAQLAERDERAVDLDQPVSAVSARDFRAHGLGGVNLGEESGEVFG